MKTLALLFLVGFFAAFSSAHPLAQSQDPPDLVVLKFSWAKERIGWERDPFSPTIENYDDVRTRIRDERRLEDAKRSGNKAEASKLERLARMNSEARSRQTTPPRYGFIYKISVKNTGSKTIKSIDWDYVFFDADTQNEIGRLKFSSEEKIGPSKSKELTLSIHRPPTETISVNELNSKERTTLNERVILMRILYSDGSVWQRP
ncbi:MAG: hypothetical protein H0T92_17855 [Pyrinomonadaceae bacterium]|nr:hypothetical protein [Pyrinomonadaceae bacterium]